MKTLKMFVFLQLMDLLTTLAWIARGGQEGNPIARWLIDLAPTDIQGMVLIKTIAILIGLGIWSTNRKEWLLFINRFFVMVVAWNLFWLVFWYLKPVLP